MATYAVDEGGPVPENWLDVIKMMENIRCLMIRRRNIKAMLVMSLMAANILLGLTISILLTSPPI